jgi:hypothetical protein
MERSDVDKLTIRTQEVLDRTKKLLKDRGISNIEVSAPETLQRPVLGMAQTEDARENICMVMEELNLDTESLVTIEKRVVNFSESVTEGPLAENFPDRPEFQKLMLYSFPPSKEHEGSSAPIVLFSHGGAIRPETSLKSPFLAIIKVQAESAGNPLILATMDHRGSDSDDNKGKYSLEDRVADVEVATQAIIDGVLPDYKKQGINWNGEVILIGNSMGGHVATIAAGELQPNRLILPQPAAYSEESHMLPLGEGFSTAIRKKSSWKTSPAFDALETYMRGGGKALIIGAERDEVIPGGVTNRYIKEVTYNYVNRATQATGNETYEVGYMYIPEVHTRTTKDEIGRISSFASTNSS